MEQARDSSCRFVQPSRCFREGQSLQMMQSYGLSLQLGQFPQGIRHTQEFLLTHGMATWRRSASGQPIGQALRRIGESMIKRTFTRHVSLLPAHSPSRIAQVIRQHRPQPSGLFFRHQGNAVGCGECFQQRLLNDIRWFYSLTKVRIQVHTREKK